MSKVRQAVETLCDILNNFLEESRLSAEMLRRAKHDECDVTMVMWTVLCELLQNVGSIVTAAKQASNGSDRECLVQFVKTNLRGLGYGSVNLQHLPTDGSSGSREVLLALGWFILKQGLIEKYAKSCLEAGMCLSDLLPDSENLPDTDVQIGESSASDKDSAKTYMLLLGRMEMEMRNFNAAVQEQVKLIHKINEETMGVELMRGIPHLLPVHAYLLANPEKRDFAEKYVASLQEKNRKICALLKWKEQESLFWRWIDGATIQCSKNSTNEPPHDTTIQLPRISSKGNSNSAANSKVPSTKSAKMGHERDLGIEKLLHTNFVYIPKEKLRFHDGVTIAEAKAQLDIILKEKKSAHDRDCSKLNSSYRKCF